MEVYDEFLEASTASLEERIFLPDIIVRAALVSAPRARLRFRAVEYLKGTEPSPFTVSADTPGRNAQWGDNEAVLFLPRATNSQARSANGRGVNPSALGAQFRWPYPFRCA